ncbi:hypothetical protein E2C01_003290 [Portunus trituberculatus]|uniref:Uncharacterized protein n=1 Tax=Portunus trituberculatus TaxID=210409 RepID=A0A5B7CPE4_PORTR|nr:hypothetical protein [Portunus trituberculatus]
MSRDRLICVRTSSLSSSVTSVAGSSGSSLSSWRAGCSWRRLAWAALELYDAGAVPEGLVVFGSL